MVTTAKTAQLRNWFGYRPSWKRYTLCLIITFSFCQFVVISTTTAATKITQFGITWKFDRDYTVGQFANGDYWVVGPVTIIGIDPLSTDVGGVIKNGSMIDPNKCGVYVNYQAFDSRAVNWTASMNVALDVTADNPLVIEPNKSLISTISRDTKAEYSYLGTQAVLTILKTAPASGSFRPPYFGYNNKDIRFNKSSLNYSLLASLTPVADTPTLHKDTLTNPNDQTETVERMFERPWIDWIPQTGGREVRPLNNFPDYGGTIANQVGIGALALHLNYTNSQKETLLIRYVQLGLDNFAVVSDPNGRLLYAAAGGNGGAGRKWPILFAGIMLNDATMKAIGASLVIIVIQIILATLTSGTALIILPLPMLFCLVKIVRRSM